MRTFSGPLHKVSGLGTQDNSEIAGNNVHSLKTLLTANATLPTSTAVKVQGNSPINPYKVYPEHLRHVGGVFNIQHAEIDILMQDKAIRQHLDSLKGRRGNNGIISKASMNHICSSVHRLAKYADLPITTDSYELIAFKKANPAEDH